MVFSFLGITIRKSLFCVDRKEISNFQLNKYTMLANKACIL